MDGSTLFDFSGPSGAVPAPMPPARRVSHTVSVLTEAEYSMLMETAAPAAGRSGPITAMAAEVDETTPITDRAFDDHVHSTAEDADGGGEADERVETTLVEAVEPAAAASSAVLADHEPGAELDRAKVVELILGINKTVAVEYLEQFKDRSLRNYLAHLETMAQPRGRGSRWERRGESPALVVHESAL